MAFIFKGWMVIPAELDCPTIRGNEKEKSQTERKGEKLAARKKAFKNGRLFQVSLKVSDTEKLKPLDLYLLANVSNF